MKDSNLSVFLYTLRPTLIVIAFVIGMILVVYFGKAP